MSTNYSGKKILILGMGLTGISCINFFLRQGIQPKIMDESISPIYLEKIPKHIQYQLGKFKKKWILEADLIIISPGISIFKPVLIQARLLGIPIISDIELFSRETVFPIIAITGTNGKSTVARIIEKIAKDIGHNVILGGNIGFPILNMIDHPKDSICIIELSSFQLDTTVSLNPKVSVVLNISEDHLDRYPEGFKQYKKSKLSIFKNSEICIFNSHDHLNIPLHNIFQKWISFGQSTSDYHISHQKNETFLSYKNKKIINTKNIFLKGNHNYMNILASIAIADAMHFSRINVQKILSNFSGLPHRLQVVHNHKGIQWINDSKSTNVNSTKAALKNITTQGTIWLLIGGDSKSANFNVLKKFFTKFSIKIYCFGKDGLNLVKICKDKSFYVETLEQAIKLIAPCVVSGDIVLLSPGCSSLDQFRNFEERGDIFTKLAKEVI